MKLSFINDPEWIVNGPATICKLLCKINFPECGELESILVKRFPLCTIYRNWNGTIGIGYTVTGVAKCHEGDAFDVVAGERLSESKAKAKAFKWGCKVASVIADYLDSICNGADNLEWQLSGLITHEEEHIKYLEGLTNTPA